MTLLTYGATGNDPTRPSLKRPVWLAAQITTATLLGSALTTVQRATRFTLAAMGLRGPAADAHTSTPKTLAYNEHGRRIGECHHRAILTNHEVDLLLELRSEGYSYTWLARKFEISREHARDICKGRRRCQTPARVVVVKH